MKITKLNADSSWLWEIRGYKILVDPWFSQSQVDFHPWFSKQFHLNPQPKVQEIPPPDFIFISHPFTDHCDRETLVQFDASVPVVCLPSIARKMKKWKHFHTFLNLDEMPFFMKKVSKTSFLDLVHHAFLISDDETSVVYAPHGTSKLDGHPHADILITTMTTYHLPFFLGGTVNLGYEKAQILAKELSAKTIISTHDEQKLQFGFVAKLSKRKYAQTNLFLTLGAGESFQF